MKPKKVQIPSFSSKLDLPVLDLEELDLR